MFDFSISFYINFVTISRQFFGESDISCLCYFSSTNRINTEFSTGFMGNVELLCNIGNTGFMGNVELLYNMGNTGLMGNVELLYNMGNRVYGQC